MRVHRITSTPQVNHWLTYAVNVIAPDGAHETRTYRALSLNSALARARSEGCKTLSARPL